ncbi:MAG: hypothetical protein ACI9DF_003930, partial [Verrucomicrobiales bacterium]
YQITSGKIEGFNNLVSRVVHRACGIVNLDYAWLKFRQLSIQPPNLTEGRKFSMAAREQRLGSERQRQTNAGRVHRANT